MQLTGGGCSVAASAVVFHRDTGDTAPMVFMAMSRADPPDVAALFTAIEKYADGVPYTVHDTDYVDVGPHDLVDGLEISWPHHSDGKAVAR